MLSRIALPLFSLILIGFVLIYGRDILLPIFTAFIANMVLVKLSMRMGQMPVIGSLPEVVRRILVFLIFMVCIFCFWLIVTGTVQEILNLPPEYQNNIDTLLTDIAGLLKMDRSQLWQSLQTQITEHLNLQSVFGFLIGSIAGLGSFVVLVALYSAFLMAERHIFPRKLLLASGNRGNAEQTYKMLGNISEQISTYLTVKTMINVMLGVICYGILKVMGVDFAVFWALAIGLLNYIPYVGSYAGVAFPVLLSLAQFGDLWTSAILTVLLIAAQFVVGNVVEPKLIGERVNLSPFVVLVSLTFWAFLWGLPGAILAIPLTSIISIICAEFEELRWVSIMLSSTVDDSDDVEVSGA